jgi:peptidoglycan-associated lipoprotein
MTLFLRRSGTELISRNLFAGWSAQPALPSWRNLVKHSSIRWILLSFALGAALFLGACAKKPVPPPPPPPPPPPQPTASLSASPNSIERGQSTTLTWETTNATDTSIDGMGPVNPSGSRQVSPSDSITYRLVAKGAGGTQEATARVTVTAPPPPQPPPPPSLTEEQMFNQNVHDIFFDYDKYDIRADQQSTLHTAASFLAQHPNIRFTVEGHCDERGSTEYNLGLGDRRAIAAKDFLVQQGVSADRIRTISYGKEKPFCSTHDEQCWQQNRRAHLVYQR